jgi:tetratricopeptide (TPR) repeat protein
MICVFLALLPLAACHACERKTSPSTQKRDGGASVRAAASAPRVLRGKPKSAAELPTTRAEIFLANLDAQIDELTRLTRAQPDTTPNLLLLSAAHHTRGRFRGDLDEIQLGIDQTSTCLKLEPDNPLCPLMRAEQEQSLHRFPEARADLERAKALGADRKRVSALALELDWNSGNYDAAIPAIRGARVAHPSTATWLREAELEHSLGHEAEADAAFEAAEDLLEDTSPLVIAHLDIQRGIQKVETGRLEEAVTFFRAAVERMPTYIAANEHLAETLHMLRQNDEATRIYEDIVARSTDPEFFHALAELYATSGRPEHPEKAAALRAKAQAGYAALLVKYPEAM